MASLTLTCTAGQAAGSGSWTSRPSPSEVAGVCWLSPRALRLFQYWGLLEPCHIAPRLDVLGRPGFREAGETWLIGRSPLNSNGPVIRGEKIGLRARHESDVPVLHSELYDDVPRGHAPTSPVAAHPARFGSFALRRDRTFGPGSVLLRCRTGVAGTGRRGPALAHRHTQPDGSHRDRPATAFRGRGFGVDVLHTLCEYGFAVNRLPPCRSRPSRTTPQCRGGNQGRVHAGGNAAALRLGVRRIRRRSHPWPRERLEPRRWIARAQSHSKGADSPPWTARDPGTASTQSLSASAPNDNSGPVATVEIRRK